MVSAQLFNVPVSAAALSLTVNIQSPVATSPLNAAELKVLSMLSLLPPEPLCNAAVLPAGEVNITVKSPIQV